MVPLGGLLAARGGGFDRWSVLRSASGISSNGRYVVGFGIHDGYPKAFLADLSGVSFAHAPEAST